MKPKMQNIIKFVLLRLINFFFCHDPSDSEQAKQLHEFSLIRLLRIKSSTVCHPEERGISASNSPKIGDYDCRVSHGDPSFLGMTKMRSQIRENSCNSWQTYFLKLFLFSVLLHYQKVYFVRFKKTIKQLTRKSRNFAS
jgi:hypothetical protein